MKKTNNFFGRNLDKTDRILLSFMWCILLSYFILAVNIECKRRELTDIINQWRQSKGDISYINPTGIYPKFKEDIDYFDVIEPPKEYDTAIVNEYGGVFRDLVERTFAKLTGKDMNSYGIDIVFVDKLPRSHEKSSACVYERLGLILIKKGRSFSTAFIDAGHEISHLTAEKSDSVLEQAVAIAGAKVWEDQLSNREEWGWSHSALPMVVCDNYSNVKDRDKRAQTIVGKLYEYYLSQRPYPLFKTEGGLDDFLHYFIREKETYLKVYHFLAESSPKEIKQELRKAEEALKNETRIWQISKLERSN